MKRKLLNLLLVFLMVPVFIPGCNRTQLKPSTHQHSTQTANHTETDSLNHQTAPVPQNNYSLLKYASQLSDESYFSLLDSIQQGLSNNFLKLRLAFAKTSSYHPYETESTDFFRKVQEIGSSGNYEAARDSLLKFAESQFVNATVHMYLGYVYNKLKDHARSDYQYSIYESLMQSIIQSGDGRRPETAFVVITPAEEYDLLNYFNMSTNGQALLGKDGHSFDRLWATDNKSGKQYDIFFNIDLPFSYMNKLFSE